MTVAFGENSEAHHQHLTLKISWFPDVVGFSLTENALGPVVRSIVSLTSSLKVISLTVLADSIHNILIYFAEKKCE